MPDKLNITELDFDAIKDNLITYFKNVTDDKGQKPYKDYDFQGSALNTLIGVLAYNTHYNAMTAHMAINESFIDSAQLRSSVVSAAKLLGYVPRSMTSSSVEAKIVVTGTPLSNQYQLPNSLYIDRNTMFKCAASYKTYYYTLKDGVTLMRDNGASTYSTASTLTLIEGQRVTKRYPINGSYDYEKYVIDDDNIDISSLIVRVYPNPTDTTNPTEYIRYENITMTSADKPLYYIAENSLGKFEITFGNGVISRKPDPLSVLELEYVITNGAAANGAGGKFTLISNPFQNDNQISYSVAITTSGSSNGGSDKETVDEIRTNATSGFVSQNRAVTPDDYKNIILKNFTTVKSVSIWGGEDNDPPQYGKVFIAASKDEPNEYADILTETEKKQLLYSISNKKVIAIIPEVVDAERINIVLDVLFKYNSNITASSKAELENDLRNGVITEYNTSQLSGFGKIFRHSEFTKKIDNSSAAILNSHVRVFLSKKIKINPQSYGNVVAKYGCPLTVDDSVGLASYFTSSEWVYNGIPIFLADKPDPLSSDTRILYTYSQYANGSKFVVHENIGNFVLSTGVLTIFPLGISDDEDEFEISIDLIPLSDDIVSKRNQIVKIDVGRCNVEGYVDEIAIGGTSRSITYQTFKRDR